MADHQTNGKRARSPRQQKRITYQIRNGKRNVKNQVKNQVSLNSLKLPTYNRFSALATNNDMDTSDQHQQQQQEQAPKKNSISPIVVTDHTSDIQAVFTELELDCNIKLNSVGRKIYVKSAEE